MQPLTRRGFFVVCWGFLWLRHGCKRYTLTTMPLDAPTITRHARHIALAGVGMAGVQRWQHAKVLVVGAGGLGSGVLPYLAAAGVGTIGICEFDAVELSNLQRQVLYTTPDVGSDKLTAITKHLHALNPQVSLITHGEFVPETAHSLVSGYDLVVDATDTPDTRYLVNDVCMASVTPWVWGAVQAWEGMVSVFIPPHQPDLRTVFTELPDAGCARLGVFGPLVAEVGAKMANQALKHLLGWPTLAGSLWIVDGQRDETRVIQLR
jgi:molybdopterin/thiamine biosynthesis adenylyltransferase